MIEGALFPPPKQQTLIGGEIRTFPRPVWEALPGSAEDYRLVLQPASLRIWATARGRPMAQATLRQLEEIFREQGRLPCLEIEDGPALAVRGFMLDISRGRVPNRVQLERLVNGLWALKFNQLQLYMEHVFAYPGHEAVWAGTGALTASDLQWLDAYCHERGIELVPNQNTFGHMEHWLKHPAYRSLAESPDGYEHPILGWREAGGVLRPGLESVAFVGELLEALLPNFTSAQLNIGCDETWELGQGASRAKAAALGKSIVFHEHLQRLVATVHKLGKRPQFWADIFLQTPPAVWTAYRNCLPVVWGYEPGHPFREALRRLREAGLPALLAPGTSAWNSFGGRWDTARGNIREAVSACREEGAEGLLLTSWGDNGHGYPTPVMWPPMVLAAALAWSGSCPPATLRQGLRLLGGRHDPAATEALLLLGGLDRWVGSRSPNMSGLYRAALGIELRGIRNPYDPTGPQRDRALEWIAAVRQRLGHAPDSASREGYRDGRTNEIREAVRLAADLSEWAVHRAAGSRLPDHLLDLGDRFFADWQATAQSPVPRVWEILPRQQGAQPPL